VVKFFADRGTACTGDFGLYSPQQVLIFPDYLYNQRVSFPLPGYYTENTELVFYIIPRGFCGGNTYLSTDPNRARITHPTANTWVIAWEDWNDGDFDDLFVQINFQPGITPFLDLPYDYTGSTFFNESRDTEQGGKVNAYFDHQYPTYCSPPNIGGCSSSDTRAVNFYGYDVTQTKPAPPYRVLYNGHDGIDYLIPQETPVLAADSGTIIFAGGISSVCKDGQTRTANVIKVQHSNGYVTEYWHLSSFAPGISVGATVSRDPSHPIGYVGSTGCSDGPHLHFLVRNPSGIVVDPYGWMPLPDAAWYGQTDPWQQYNTWRC
jgi:murein DD-endopeptidase MepM/ murein hydrolase activator NlpD